MKYFDFELLGIKRKLPFVKVKGRLSLASFVVISDTELVQAAAPELVKRLPNEPHHGNEGLHRCS